MTDSMSQLPVELFIIQISYLHFKDVINICYANKKLHTYCYDPKYKNYWKSLVDNTFKDTYSYYDNLKKIWNHLKVPDNTYNYLVYTRMVKLLDPINQLMIFFRQGDLSSFNDPEFNNTQRFLAMFLLGEKTEIKNLLPDADYHSFMDLMEGKEPSPDILNEMMFKMAKEGSSLGVSIFLEKGVNIQAGGDIAVSLASQNGHLETVKFLVSKGANIHVYDDSSLKLASKYGHLETVKFLVSQGADIHADDDLSLSLASENGHLETVKFLVSQGANIHGVNDYAIIWASLNRHHDVVSYLRSLPQEITEWEYS